MFQIRIAGFSVAYVLLGAAVLLARLSGAEAAARFLIPALVGYAAGWLAVFPGAWAPERVLLVGVLFASLLGDVVLCWTPWMALCILPFSVAHLCLFLLFRRLRPRHPVPVRAAALLLLAGLLFWFLLRGRMPGAAEAAVAAAYQLLLAVMLWSAWALRDGAELAGSRWLFAGALLYYVTDHVVIFHQLEGSRYTLAFIWVFYPLALYCLARGGAENAERSRLGAGVSQDG